MSRIGSSSIEVPATVSVSVAGTIVTATGPKGELSMDIDGTVSVDVSENLLSVKPLELDDKSANKNSAAIWGLSRTLLRNMIVGVSEGFTKVLEIKGVGYRAAMKGNNLNLSLGFSHPVEYIAPTGITITCPNQTTINVSGSEKQKVGQVAADIRRYRPPEPYKGKGIRYQGEYVRIKEGKKK